MLKTNFVFVGAILQFLLLFTGTSGKFKVIREWNYVNFTWPSVEVYQNALEQQLYLPENNIIAGIKYYEGFYYITLPRMKSGVPATLTRIPAGFTSDTTPLLFPFPTWEMNNVDDCSALQNVQNIEIDLNGQMWIIDGGRTETLSRSSVVKCKPKLLVYDIKKMENILTYTFPENVASFNGSFLYDIVIDNTDQGYAYITDNTGRDPGIIVFSVKDHHAWKIRHSESMRADPNASFFRVNGLSVSATINIASIALGPRIRSSGDRIVVSEEREVFYAPLSSFHLYSISTSVLKNEDFSIDNGEYQGDVKDYGLKASQSVGMIMDNQGILYYSLLASNSIARWDSSTPFQTGQKIIAKDDKYLEWPNSFTFDDSGNLTLLVNRLNKFIYDKLNINEPNFRLITSHVGGRNYLYDETYSYDSRSSSKPTISSTISTTITTENQKPFKPGTDQDPYMAPQPEPEQESKSMPELKPVPGLNTESEPKPEPTIESSTTKTELLSSLRSDLPKSSVTTIKPETTTAGSEKLAVGVMSLLAAVMVFLL